MNSSWLTLIPLLAAAYSSPALAGECEELIALSKIATSVTQDQSSIEAHAKNYCSQYSKSTGSSKSLNVSASYKVLSGALGTSRSSFEDVASAFCDASNSYAARKDAYRQYVETIAPGAYDAYAKCKEAAHNDVRFSLEAHLPNEFIMLISFTPLNKGQVADLAYETSSGIQCVWKINGKETGGPTSLKEAATLPLLCKRANAGHTGFVTIIVSNSARPGNRFTFKWTASADVRCPNDSLCRIITDLEKRVADLEDKTSMMGIVKAESRVEVKGVAGDPEFTTVHRCWQVGALGVCAGTIFIPQNGQTHTEVNVKFAAPFSDKPIFTTTMDSFNHKSQGPVAAEYGRSKISRDGFAINVSKLVGPSKCADETCQAASDIVLRYTAFGQLAP